MIEYLPQTSLVPHSPLKCLLDGKRIEYSAHESRTKLPAHYQMWLVRGLTSLRALIITGWFM